MPQTNYTPILIYASSTTGNTPAAGNLTNSAGGAELAINYFDGRLFYKDASNVVQVLATKGTGTIGGSNTQVQFNSSGALAGSSNMTFNGTTLSVNGLTVTNNPTFNGGTANGVLYLDGSKVVTSGTALTFNGTNLSLTAAGGAYFYTPNVVNGGGIFDAGGNNGMLIFGNVGGSTLRFLASGAEQMRLNSTGLGIGTTSPFTRLDSASARATTLNSAALFNTMPASVTDTTAFAVGVGGGINFRAQLSASSYSTYAAIWSHREVATNNDFKGSLAFGTANNSTGYPVERLRLDSAGNLGLGITPDAWESTYRALSLASFGGASIAGRTSTSAILLTSNAFRAGSGNWTYVSAGPLPAARYEILDGAHQWFNAASGTAGNIISFTQAMTLDASGNLGIGLTNQTFRLEVSNASAVPARFNRNQAGQAIGALIFNQPNTTDGNSLTLRYTSDTTGAGAATDVPFAEIEFAADIHNQATRAGSIRFLTSLGGVGNSQERMRLDANGNLGIGTTNPGTKLDVNGSVRTGSDGSNVGLYLGASSIRQAATGGLFIDANSTGAAGGIFFRDSSSFTTRMQIDASGNLGLGVTPSATQAAHRSIELFGSLWMGGNSVTPASYFYTNAYFDGADRYKTSGFAASLYRQVSGAHAWLTAPSGTAGNAISFTQAMTLTAAGGLVVGLTTDPGAGNISAKNNFRLNSNTYTRVADDDGSGGFGGGYNLALNATNTPKHDSLGAAAGYRYGTGGDVFFFTSGSQAAGSNIPQRLLIDSAGNIVPGTAAIATNATNGFLYVPTCAGTPTGTPTTYTGRSPIVVDSTNNKLYFYSGGAWRDAGP